MELRVEPIRRWPGEPTKYRKRSQFDSTYSQTMQLLDRELYAVAAKAVVLQMAVDGQSIRLDGGLRAGTRPTEPGVILSFTTTKHGAMRFACDRFTTWEENLRAIALGMEALRKVERYGITSDGQQYAGFKALESAEDAAAFVTIEDAARFIAGVALNGEGEDRAPIIAEAMLVDDELAATYFRRAARNAHPDTGGDEKIMARLNAARSMLEGGA